jgi:hypothetical protein
VGDDVRAAREAGDFFIIEAVLPRRTLLQRKRAGRRSAPQNITRAGTPAMRPVTPSSTHHRRAAYPLHHG